MTYDPAVIEVTSCAVTGTSVTGTCTGAPGALAVAFERASVAAISGTVSILRLEVVVRSPGEYAVTFASPAFEDDSGAAVPVGLPPRLSLSTGATLTPTVTRTLTTTPTVASTVAATPVTVSGPFADLTAGGFHTCGLVSSGEAYCWGWNAFGQIGDGTNGSGSTGVDRTVPVRVIGSLRFASLTAGYGHTCGLTVEGQAYCWGDNTFDQLGIGIGGQGSYSENRAEPELVAGGIRFISLAAGQLHTCGLTESRIAYCWGNNSNGELGDGTVSQAYGHPYPVRVVGGLTFASIAPGYGHTCALTTVGAAYCWGQNTQGQVGNGVGDLGGGGPGSAVSKPTLVLGGRTFSHLASGNIFTVGLTVDGAAHCWGQIGISIDAECTSYPSLAAPVTVRGGRRFASITAGDRHVCGLIASGSALCWGGNADGQLGDGTGALTPPYGERSSPVPVLGGYAYTKLTAGLFHTCGLTAAGGAVCWGRDWNGQVGDGGSGHLLSRPSPVLVDGSRVVPSGQTTPRPSVTSTVTASPTITSTPTLVKTPTVLPATRSTYTQLAAGRRHACGLTANGYVNCWGQNNVGQLGRGYSSVWNEPVLPGPVLQDEAFTYIKSGQSAEHTCAIGISGDTWCWGNSGNGQLGVGPLSGVDTSRPLRVSGGHKFSALALGTGFSCGLETSGHVWCWGTDYFGELGIPRASYGNVQNYLAPEPVQGLPAQIIDIGAGSNHVCAVASGGASFCWGWNGRSALGNGNVGVSDISKDIYMPISIATLKFFMQIRGGNYSSCALTTDQTTYCWGLRLGFGESAYPILVDGPRFSQISLGALHGCGITTESHVYCWGSNAYGQIGDGTASGPFDQRYDRPQPVEVLTTLEFSQVEAGESYTCGLAKDGRAWCWGGTFHGELGNDGTFNSLVPVPVRDAL